MKIKLDARERLALLLGLAVTLLVLALLAYIPTGPKKRYEASRTELARLHGQLVLSQMLKADEEARLQSQEKMVALLDARSETFDLFSFVNRMLGVGGLKERAELENVRIRRVSQRQPMVQLRLSRVSLTELLDFLHKLYDSGDLIVMYKLDRLRPAPKDQGIDCELTLVTVKV